MFSKSFSEYSDSPCRVGSINKKLLTPCRPVGLSRKRKSLALGELNRSKAEHEPVNLANSVNSQKKVADSDKNSGVKDTENKLHDLSPKKVKRSARNSNKTNKSNIKDDLAAVIETKGTYEDPQVNENANIIGNVNHKAEEVADKAKENSGQKKGKKEAAHDDTLTPPRESLKLLKSKENSGRKKGKNKTSTNKKAHEDNVKHSQDHELKLKNQSKSPYRDEHLPESDEESFCAKKTFNAKKHLKKINVMIDSDEDSFSSTNSSETSKNLKIPKKNIPERSSNRCRETRRTLSKSDKSSEKKKVARELSLKDIKICPDSEMQESVVLLSRGIEHDHLTYCKQQEKNEDIEKNERTQQEEKLEKTRDIEDDKPEERTTIKEDEQANKSGKQYLKSTKLRRILSMKKSTSFEETLENENRENDFGNMITTDQKDSDSISISSSGNENKDILVPVEIPSSINQLVSVHDSNDSAAKEEMEENELLKEVFTLEEKIKEKRDKVARLRQAQIYHKKHNIDQLRELHLLWKKGCILGLKDLLKSLKSHGPMDMPTLLRKFQISSDMVTLTPQGELV